MTAGVVGCESAPQCCKRGGTTGPCSKMSAFVRPARPRGSSLCHLAPKRLAPAMQLAGEHPGDSPMELWEGEVSDASDEDASVRSVFSPVVAHDLGDIEGASCWLFNDPHSAGAYKLVACVEQRDVLLLAAQIHENCAHLQAVCGAKLYFSDELLLVVYLSAYADKADDLLLAFDGIYLLDFTPYGALTGVVSPLWVALSNVADSPAVPFDAWTAAGEGDLL